MEENAARNATALKHVVRRLALLGDEATPEHRHRLEEEQSALQRLARKHEGEMQRLVRYQERKKLELLRKQEKEFEDLSSSFERNLDALTKEKTTQLHINIAKLDDILEDRRAKLVGRWYLRLQIFKTKDKGAATIKPALPLSLLGLPQSFTAALGYT